MAKIVWGIPEAAVAALKKHGGTVENTKVFDIEYGKWGGITRITAEPTATDDEIKTARP